MRLEQIYTGCLAQGAYFIESAGEAVIIDPLREVEPYIKKATQAGAIIKYIFETHFHADFVSGHRELADKTGATIVYGPTAETNFPAHIGRDGERFSVGDVEFELLHTPGHTMESACFLLRDKQGKEVALFTGDTLFIDDVGRPDLAQKPSADITQETLAGLLFESLHNRICKLPDDITVYPAHGAGSACGKNMSKETSDTLGHQKETNYALRKGISKTDFVREVTDGLLPPPPYFPMNVQLNREGADPLQAVMEKGTKALPILTFEQLWQDRDAIVLDTRSASDFAKGFMPGAINIGIDGSFAPWVGALLPYKKQPILFIADEGREEEVVTRLARVGYDNTIGYLKGGFDAWQQEGKPIDSVETATASEMAQIIQSGIKLNVLDVRKESEFQFGHLHGAHNVPLDRVNELQEGIDKAERYYVHCAGGYRSMVFISILKARGYQHLVDVQGGFNALTKTSAFAALVAS